MLYEYGCESSIEYLVPADLVLTLDEFSVSGRVFGGVDCWCGFAQVLYQYLCDAWVAVKFFHSCLGNNNA